MTEPDDPPCAHCGRPKSEHIPVPPHKGEWNVLICPRNVYVPDK
jgi:hypothetical protein